MRGIVFDIARFSLNDGPGIRTTVFLKGCPLRCLWCHNPESQVAQSELFWSPERCIGCGRCISVCPQKCHSQRRDGHQFDRGACTACGACANVCFSGALSQAGRSMESDEVLEIVRRDRDYYGKDGGLTLSGGEPLSQPEFSRELLNAARRESWTTAVETSGFAPWCVVKSLLPVTDLWLFDLKCADSKRHRELTGVPNERILENLHRLDEAGAQIELRFPLIPGRNDSDRELEALQMIASGVRNLVGTLCEPYHPFGLDKLRRLGRAGEPSEKVPDEKDLQRYHRFLSYRCVKQFGKINSFCP